MGTVKHTLIVGEQGVGKSTLIRRVLAALDVTVGGYITRKEDALADPQLGSPIYIYEAGQPQTQTQDNLVGHCRDQRPLVYPEAFDRFVPKLQNIKARDQDLILLDEVGTMETRANTFCPAILELLDGDTPILAAVKYKDCPYLEQVRSHPNCQCFTITEENRDELFEMVLTVVHQQLICSNGEKKNDDHLPDPA